MRFAQLMLLKPLSMLSKQLCHFDVSSVLILKQSLTIARDTHRFILVT
jgi:hypothetical protein